jgi:hypothetical protein
MSMYERNPGSPVVVSNKIAEQIRTYLGIDNLTVDEIVAKVPVLKSLDKAMTTIQDVYNDCLLAQQDLADLDGDNLNSTKNALEDAFREVTGEDCEEYGVSWDPDAGPEAEDDEGTEGSGEDGAVAHGEE